MAYESVIGRGKIRILPDDEKMPSEVLMNHYYHEDKMHISTQLLFRVTLVYTEVGA